MNQLTTINRICEHLEKYVFDKIWNDPYAEYRTFTVAEYIGNYQKVSDTFIKAVPSAGIFFGRYNQVQLPSEVSYIKTGKLFFYMYAIPADQFRSLHLNVLEWVSLAEYCSNNLIDIEFFSDGGRKMLRDGVFICQAEKNDCILVAVEQTAFIGCLGDKTDPMGRLYFGEMFDSDLHPSVVYDCFRLSSGASASRVDATKDGKKPTYILYNGKLLSGAYQKFISAFGYVERVFDENIIGIFDTPMSQKYTNESVKERLLVHIPKTINKDHVIITPNTCDLYLVPTEMEPGAGNSTVNGIYLFQCGRDEHFHQLTHNDFSIDFDWLKELATQNRFKKWVVRTMVRTCDKDKKAIRDANYLNILYLHTDEEILEFLLGSSSWSSMYFWTARHLERGMYGNAEMRRRNVLTPVPSQQCELCAVKDLCGASPITDRTCITFNRRSLNDYIDLIGYYHTLALIGKRVTYFEVTDDLAGNNEFVVRAPLALQEFDVNDYYAVVYWNGIRVDPKNIVLRDGVDVRHLNGDIEHIKGISAANAHNRELEFTQDASWWTKVIDINYSYRIRVIINNQQIKTGDKVVVELFDSRKDGGMMPLDVPSSASFTETSDTSFIKGKRYFYKYNDAYYTAKIKDEYIGQPIDGEHSYDVCLKIIVEEPYRHYEVVPVSEFYELDHEMFIQLHSVNDWKIYFVNEEQDKRYYRTRDNVFVDGKQYYLATDAEGRPYTVETDGYDMFDYEHWHEATTTTKFVPAEVTPGQEVGSQFFYFELISLPHVNNVTFYELQDPGDFDEDTMILNLDPRHFGKKLFLVDGPIARNDGASEDITENSVGFLGKALWPEPIQTLDNFPLDSELVFLNHHRLIRGLDYTMEGYNPGDYHNGARLYLQNVSYLKQHSEYQVVRTCQTTLSNQRGFLKGNIVYWNHQNPFWFDELSVLTIGGKVCANLIHEFGTITLMDGPNASDDRDFMTLNHPGGYDNGSPFEFRMSVSSKIKRLVGDHGQAEDNEKIGLIKEYFDAKFKKPDYITVVKRSHKIYSLYTEQIITAYVKDPNFDFVLTPSDISFEDQFADFTDWKMKDVAFTLTAEELKYVDIYPLYNRLKTADRYQYKKISQLAKRLLPVDKYQHKDASNVK